MSAREEILARVRAATTDLIGVPVPPPPFAPVGGADLVSLFAERVADYRADVRVVTAGELPGAIAAALSRNGAREVVTPAGLDPTWVGAADGIRVVVDDGLSASELDGIDAVVTAARVGIAETGTIVLDHGPDQGRRAISLVPDLHVCVIRADQVVADVPDAVDLLRASAGQAPLTWISGPSATSDIELDRVEGVHGPRNLVVLIVQ